MTANQRRPGFRLPWSSETDEPGAEPGQAVPASEGTAPAAPVPATPATPATRATSATPATPASAAAAPAAPTAPPAPPAPAAATEAEPTPGGQPGAEEPAAEAEAAPAAEEVAAPPAAAAPVETDGGDDFMRDLVSAMRRVADEAREAGVADLRARADEQVRLLESEAERRNEDLRARAEADVDAVGEWAKAEAERITKEAEQRVVARRSQLEEQLAGDAQRTEAETKALRDRVAQYERELDAYHGQLGQIGDPAAFAAAAKRMPKAPELGSTTASTTPAAAATLGANPATETAVPEAAPPAADAPAADAPVADAPVEPSTTGSNGVPIPSAPVHPAEEEVLAARLAQLDATLPAATSEAGVAASVGTEPVTTEVVVKGLGSFGAITGFRQALSGVYGIDGVALSLGQTGEFVFRATHAAGFDVRGAIVQLEGDAATIEDRPEGGLRVTLDRAR